MWHAVCSPPSWSFNSRVMVWAVLVECSSALAALEARVVGSRGLTLPDHKGKRPLCPGERGKDDKVRGGGYDKRAFCRCTFTVLTPFSSPLHMNNKKPLWHLSNSLRQCVWLCVCVCERGVVQDIWPRESCDRADILEKWECGQLLSKCHKEQDFWQKRSLAALFHVSVRISEAIVGCQHGSGSTASPRWAELLIAML